MNSIMVTTGSLFVGCPTSLIIIEQINIFCAQFSSRSVL